MVIPLFGFIYQFTIHFQQSALKMQYLFHWILSGSTVHFIIFCIYLSSMLKMDAYMPYSQKASFTSSQFL